MSVDQLSPKTKKLHTQEFTAADTNLGGDWKKTPTGLATTGNYYRVAYGNGVFVAVGYDSTNTTNVIMTSTDGGVTWTQTLTSSPGGVGLSGVAYSPTLHMWVALGNVTNANNQVTYTSTNDGASWTLNSGVLPSSTVWIDVCWHIDRFIAIAGGQTASTAAATSTNGTSWVSKTLPTSEAYSRIVSDGSTRAIMCGGGAFGSPIVQYNSVVTTDDGVTFTNRGIGQTKFWSGLTYGNGYWVMTACASDNLLAYSNDSGVTWGSYTQTVAMSYTALAYGGSTYVLVEDGFVTGQPAVNVALYTTSPQTGASAWTTRMTDNVSQPMKDVAYGGGTFVAVGQTAGFVYLSKVPTATSWTCPAGVYEAEILAVGGAAGAGGSNTGTVGCGGGAGAGQVIKKRVSVTPGTTYAITVGLGGVGCKAAATTAAVATAGTDTTFGTLVRAFGGQPGAQFGVDAVAGKGPGGGGGGAAAALSAGGGGAGAAGPGENPFYIGTAITTGKAGALSNGGCFAGANGSGASAGYGKGGPGLFGYGKGGDGGGPISQPGQSVAGTSAGLSGAPNTGNGGNGGIVGSSGAGGWGGTGYLSVTWEA